jgi:hypothetical protein
MKSNLIVGITAFSLMAVFTPTSLTAQSLRYGTSRVPQTCPSRLEPQTGAISAKQAEKYFTCHAENGGKPGEYLKLITDLKIQVAPKPRRARRTDEVRAATLANPITLNMDKPVYDIKGSYKSYFCNTNERGVADKTNCILSVYPNSQGICFQNNFNEWFCLLTGSFRDIRNQAPPQ